MGIKVLEMGQEIKRLVRALAAAEAELTSAQERQEERLEEMDGKQLQNAGLQAELAAGAQPSVCIHHCAGWCLHAHSFTALTVVTYLPC